jgi:hypothetical protein
MGKMSNYKAPKRDVKMNEKLGYLAEAVQEGRAFNEKSRARMDFQEAAKLISGIDDDEMIPDGQSKIMVNEVKRGIREHVAVLSNFGTIGTYSTDNKEYDRHKDVLNRCLMSWWYQTFADRKYREALQWAAVFGTSYISPIYEKDFWCFGRGDIALHVYGPDQVLLIQLPKSKEIQKAYMVLTVTEVPLNLAHAIYPEYQDVIIPTHGSPSWLSIGRSRIEKFLSPVLQLFGQGANPQEESSFPTVDIYNAYIMDTEINMGPDTIPMGEPGSSWQYNVPPWKSEIPTGNGTYKKATVEDARLYPLRRHMVATPNFVIKDDSSPWWHGKAPTIRICLDDWPWDHLGFSLAKDTISIQNSNNELLRAVEDAMRVRLDPPIQYDEDNVAANDMAVWHPRMPGTKVASNFQMGDSIKKLFDASQYDVPPIIIQHIQQNEERIRHLLSVKEVQAMARLKQMPSGESLDKLFEASSPIINDESRSMEAGIRDMGEMLKSLFFQYYGAPRRMQMGGPSMVVPEDWYFDPEGMIPSHIDGEDRSKFSKLSRVQRARWHQNNFIFNSATKNLHEIQSMKTKLMLIQASKSGIMPVDPWTAAEVLGFGDRFGKAPDEAGTTIYERQLYWLGVQASMKQAMAESEGGGGGDGGGGGQEGRPPSGKAGPKIASKEGGARSTIKESR